jgi:large subunit ribosomal protein L17
MRHGKKINHLGRKTAHRAALLSNMASSLILNKRITTTVAKAKALRKYVEPLLTKAKDDTTHSRRTVFSYLQNKESVKTLFGEVAGKIADRPGGYTRIIKFGDVRVGDNAEMCLIELVDFNTLYTKDGAVKKGKTRRSRRGGKKEGAEGAEETGAEAAEPKAKKAKAPKAEKADKAEKTEKKPAKKSTKKDKE